MPIDKAAELTSRFALIDTNGNGKLEIEELKAVFGEHAQEFLKFCDGQDGGEKEGELTKEEFIAGITGDTADMSDEDFQADWLDRMSKCIEDAKAAAPAAEKPDMKPAIAKLVEAFNVKYNADDTSGCAEVFAEVCDVTVNGGETAKCTTRAEVATFLDTLRNTFGATNFKITPTGENLGDNGLGSTDTWTSDWGPGNCTSTWECQDGNWVIVKDIIVAAPHPAEEPAEEPAADQ